MSEKELPADIKERIEGLLDAFDGQIFESQEYASEWLRNRLPDLVRPLVEHPMYIRTEDGVYEPSELYDRLTARIKELEGRVGIKRFELPDGVRVLESDFVPDNTIMLSPKTWNLLIGKTKFPLPPKAPEAADED